MAEHARCVMKRRSAAAALQGSIARRRPYKYDSCISRRRCDLHYENENGRDNDENRGKSCRCDRKRQRGGREEAAAEDKMMPAARHENGRTAARSKFA